MYSEKLKTLVLVMILLSTGLQAQIYEKSKQFSQSFPVNRSTEVTITNKYGNVHLINWEKDSVKFEVNIRVSSSKQFRVDKAFNEIDIKFTTSPYYVIANTTFAGSGKIWSEITDITKTMVSTGNIAEINYTVYLPGYAKITIDNRFGNVYTTDHFGTAEFRVSNGTFQANKLTEKCLVVVEFGNANIKRIDQGRVELNYAELELEEAGNLTLTGRSSTIHIRKAAQLQLNSRRDRIRIEEIEKLEGESSFTRLNINNITGSYLLNANYGTITVSGFAREFKSLQLISNYAVNNFYLDNSHFSSIEINYKARTKLSLPNEVKVSERRDPLPGSDEGFLKAAVGTGNLSDMRMNTTGGEVNFFFKP